MLLSGKRGPEPKIVGERRALLVRRYLQGERVTALAGQFGVSPSTVYAAFSVAGVRTREVCKRGEHTAKTISQVARAVALAEAGKPHREIATALRLTRARVSQLIALGKELPRMLPGRATTPENLAARETVSRVSGGAPASKEPPDFLPQGVSDRPLPAVSAEEGTLRLQQLVATGRTKAPPRMRRPTR